MTGQPRTLTAATTVELFRFTTSITATVDGIPIAGGEVDATGPAAAVTSFLSSAILAQIRRKGVARGYATVSRQGSKSGPWSAIISEDAKGKLRVSMLRGPLQDEKAAPFGGSLRFDGSPLGLDISPAW